jgi:hypothetical protein
MAQSPQRISSARFLEIRSLAIVPPFSVQKKIFLARRGKLIGVFAGNYILP